jgi:hypothetical protein
MTQITAQIKAFITNNAITNPYDITTSAASGVMNVTPNVISTGASFISIISGFGMTADVSPAITFTTTASGNYKMVEYPYIPDITDNAYMISNVLNNSSSPYVITSTTTTDVSQLLIPIILSLDYASLNPSDIDTTPLGYGSISIPSYLPNSSTTPYMNFSASNIDDNVVIEIVALPVKDIVYPYSQNNIVKLGQITQNGINIDDAVIQLESI